MSYKISIRLTSENIESLTSLNISPYNFKLLKRGDPVRPNSKFQVTQNMLICDCIDCTNFDQDNVNLIINIIDALKKTDNKIKKELLISNVVENDQYGFELPPILLKCLSENDFSIVISGVFV